MPLEGESLTERFITRGSTEPSRPLDGQVWIYEGANNTEQYTFNRDTGNWELYLAFGPDTPAQDFASQTEQDGALWGDTGNDTTKRWDSNNLAWEVLGSAVSDSITWGGYA